MTVMSRMGLHGADCIQHSQQACLSRERSSPCRQHTHQKATALDAVHSQSILFVSLRAISSSGVGHAKVNLIPAGPAAEDGLQLKSFRVENGLSGTLQLASKYQAFPGKEKTFERRTATHSMPVPETRAILQT